MPARGQSNNKSNTGADTAPAASTPAAWLRLQMELIAARYQTQLLVVSI